MVSFMNKDMNYSLANANEDYNNLVLNPYNYNMNFLYPFNLMYPSQGSMGSKSKVRKLPENLLYPVSPIDKNDKVKLTLPTLPESNREELMEWINSLSFEERFELFTIEDQCLCMIIIKMFWKNIINGEKSFAQYQHQDKIGKDIEAIAAVRGSLRQELIFKPLPVPFGSQEGLTFINRVVFDENLKAWIWEAPFWFKPNSFQSISSWVVAHFEKSIWIKFFTENKLPPPPKTLTRNGVIHKENLLLRIENLKNFWMKLEKAKRKKILSKSDEFLKLLGDSSPNTNNQLIKFYFDVKENLKSPGSSFCSEETLEHYHSLIDNKKATIFFESIVFTELNKTDKITGIIDRYIFQEINEIYTQFMAQELISSENKKKRKKKKKPQKKNKKNATSSEEPRQLCSCQSPYNCDIKPFVECLAHSLLVEAVKRSSMVSSKKKVKNHKKSKKNNEKKKPSLPTKPCSNSENSFSLEPCSLEKQDEISKASEENNDNKEDFAFEAKKSSEFSKFDNLEYLETGEDFIEVKSKKSKSTNMNKQRCPLKMYKNSDKGGKNLSNKSNQKPNNEKKSSSGIREKARESVSLEPEVSNSTSSLTSKTNERTTKEIKPPHSEQVSSNPAHTKTPLTANETSSIKKSPKNPHYNHHYLESELEKELKNPPSIHLSKNKAKKEENSSRTVSISTKGGMDYGETTSQSDKTKKSSSLNATYLSGDEPFPEINLVDIDEFPFDALEDDEDQSFCDIVNYDLNDFLNEMQENAPQIMNYRSVMFERLYFIVSNMFPEYQPNIRLYGSCATGLALPTSDMDIGITGFETLSTYDSTQILQVLLSKLTYLKWVKTYRPIFTASIPVLKLEVDPFVAFDEFTYPNPPIDFISKDEDYGFLNIPKSHVPEKLRHFTIKLDITIETSSFYNCPSNSYFMPSSPEFTGLLSTNLTKTWLVFYSSLMKMTLILKYLLNSKRLNNTYNGGISSYCLILMIVAFLKAKNIGHDDNYALLLYNFFNFYGNFFDLDEMGISFQLEPSPFFQISKNMEKEKGKLLVYDPVIYLKNITKNAYLSQKILAKFKTCFEYLSELRVELRANPKKAKTENIFKEMFT